MALRGIEDPMSEFQVVSLFAGAGGLSRGFSDAGLRPLLAAEIDGDAVATYRANVSNHAIQVDIAQEPDRVVREVERRSGGRDLLAVVGGPPCQGFSTAGARDHADPRNQLVFSYLRIVERLQPSWFLFENVEGMLTSGGGDAVVGLAESFARLGYAFRVEKVNFAGLGVPQARKRIIIVGNRRGIDFALPEASHAFEGKKHRSTLGVPSTTVSAALAGLPATPASSLRDSVRYETETPVTSYDAMLRTCSPGPRHHTCSAFSNDAERISLLKPGQSMRDLPEEFWHDSFRRRAFRRVADGMPTEKRGGAPAGIRRLQGDHASLTITSLSSREFIHPEHNRPLTLRECARLQSFPDGHDFQGNFQAVATQIGNAFPPIAARAFAEWLQVVDGAAGASVGSNGSTVGPGLLGYHLTEAKAMSPALQETDRRLRQLVRAAGRSTHVSRVPRTAPSTQGTLFPEPTLCLALTTKS